MATQYIQTAGQHQWLTAPSGTAGNAISFTQAMTLDASGNLLVGNSTDPIGGNRLLVQSASTANNNRTMSVYNTAATSTTAFANRILQLSSNASGADVSIQFSDQVANNAYIGMGSGALYFAIGSGTTKNMTLDASGNLLVGTTSVITAQTGVASKHNISTSAGTAYGLTVSNQSTEAFGLAVKYTVHSPNNGGNNFLWCADGGGTERAAIYSNGGLANYSANNVNLSDQRVKKDIQNASSYLAKICAIPVRTFLYKDQTDSLLNLGVIAQEVETIAPELVDIQGFGDTTPDDGIPLKAIYQTDLQYALMKCIQEQQAIIESLKARLDAANL